MSLRLRLYVYGVMAMGVGLLALTWPTDATARVWHYLLWVVICVLTEPLWLPTLSGQSFVSMASTANLTMLMLWGREPTVWMVVLSSLIAGLTVQKREQTIRLLFNTAQWAISLWLAGVVMALAGAPPEGLARAGLLAITPRFAVSLVPAFVAMTVTFYAANRLFTVIAVSWSSGRGVLQTLREDWLYREQMFADAALFLLAPLMVMSYAATSYLGVVLFYVPIYIIYLSSKRYLELVSSQSALIQMEKAAAVGDMVAEVGHELRGPLTVVRERSKMILRALESNAVQNVERHANEIVEQSERMKDLADSLMDYRERKVHPQPTEINALITKKVEQVKILEAYQGVTFDLDLEARIPPVPLDPGQIGDVMLILFNNATEIMEQHSSPVRRIVVETSVDRQHQRLVVTVEDSGPGIPPGILPKIFLKHFSAKKGGHGFGLSKAAAVVSLHGGEIVASSPEGHGAVFRLTLPLHGPKAA